MLEDPMLLIGAYVEYLGGINNQVKRGHITDWDSFDEIFYIRRDDGRADYKGFADIRVITRQPFKVNAYRTSSVEMKLYV